MNRELMNNIHPLRGYAPLATASADDTALVTEIIDTQGFDSLVFLLMVGVLADANATFVVLVEDGDDSGLSDNDAVADAELVGTEALSTFLFSDDNETRKIGYLGGKRYVRLTFTPAANTGAVPFAVIAVLGHPDISPTANPPV